MTYSSSPSVSGVGDDVLVSASFCNCDMAFFLANKPERFILE
jgi:hypothetical protein